MSNIVNFDTLSSALKTRRYTETYSQVPTKAIGSELKSQFDFIFGQLGVPTPDSFLTVKAEGGALSRLYTPVLYGTPIEDAEEYYSNYAKEVGQPVSEVADTQGVRFTKDLVVPLKSFPMADLEFESTENGNVVNIFFEDFGEEGLIFPVRMLIDGEAKKAIELKKALSGGKLGSFLMPLKFGNSYLKLAELGENTEHIAIGYESKESAYGDSYTLVLDNGTKVFCNSALSDILQANPLISKEKPATLYVGTISLTRTGKQKVNVVLQPHADAFAKVTDIDLDW